MDARRRAGRRPRVVMTTEGTYPFVTGGVSTWCDQILTGIDDVDWDVLPVVAGGRRRKQIFELPRHARLLPGIDLWFDPTPRWRPGVGLLGSDWPELPGELCRSLLRWDATHASLLTALTWCRLHPARIRPAFRRAEGWKAFREALDEVVRDDANFGGLPEIDRLSARELYGTLYWVARCAAVGLPAADAVHVTAAGWAGIPAVTERALNGTPLLLTEHGVYIREAYLASVRRDTYGSVNGLPTRLSWGLVRATYRSADVVAPVTDANARWEELLGVDPSRIVTVPNGVAIPETVTDAPGDGLVVSVGRIDPLKDVHTMLRVAAEVVRTHPGASFLHYGPVSEGQEGYARSCLALHDRLRLGDRFRFMGRTDDPGGVLRDADAVLITSISEGLPIAALEAMAAARPVVATTAGGLPDALEGCGITAPPGDTASLAAAVLSILGNPALGRRLGRLARAKVQREFPEHACLDSYRELLAVVTGRQVAA